MPSPGIVDIATAIAETLAAKVVRYALHLELLQACIKGLVVGCQGGKAQGEAVRRVSAALQLALVAHLLQYAQGVVFGTRQVRVGLARQVQAEPLAGQGLAVLRPA